ncbi:unnamed protein product [Clonostachys byssicola]|uniref:Rhodopsin domain-containing protein n=1 Tax=Clonostachys byssicola TaxID=160290 RepID=A0A9N9UMC8_9HYPO|nr:unnamed protein product [Clonostachys byssicola]
MPFINKKYLSAIPGLVDFGLGRPNENNPYGLSVAEIRRKGWFLLFLASETYTFAIVFCKFAILAFYWRIFKYTSIRIAIQVLSVVTMAWFLLRVFMVSFQCVPIQALWDPSIKNGRCTIKKPTLFFSTGLTHLLIELVLLILPATELRKLHLPLGQKIAVILLFMTGILTCIASIFVAITAMQFDQNTQELGLDLAKHMTWRVAEVNLAGVSSMYTRFAILLWPTGIIPFLLFSNIMPAASLPLILPIIRKIVPGRFLNSHSERPPLQAINIERSRGRLTSIIKKRIHNAEGASSRNELANLDSNKGSAPLSIAEPCLIASCHNNH